MTTATYTPRALLTATCLPATLAQRLADRFEVHYTPKCGSWLNQIELDFSALNRQCPKRRIPA